MKDESENSKVLTRGVWVTGWMVLGILHVCLTWAGVGFGNLRAETLSGGTPAAGAQQAQAVTVNPALAKTSHTWLDADGKPLPFQGEEQICQFLEAAPVVEMARVKEGITGVRRVLLEKDGIRVHAYFRDVSIEKRKLRMADGTLKLNFRDDCVFELAAYRVGRLVGLDNIPPTVARTIKRTKGTLQMGVENAIMEKERRKRNMQSPSPLKWVYQQQLMHVFDNLVYNDDRNQGNSMIDVNWKLWMIDHGRCFRLDKKLKNPQMIRYCSRTVWENLKKLNKDQLETEMKGLLRGSEIRALLTRRDLLVKHIQGIIDKKGEGAVLF